MPRQGGKRTSARSRKAGRPPEPTPVAPRVRRRMKTAHAAFRKDTMLLESPQDPRARWPGARPKFKKG